ncbi:hypothetical protein ACFQVA_25360 [Actinomadura keratinilytica]
MRNRRTARAATLTVLLSGAALAAAGTAQADPGQSPQPSQGAAAQDTLQGLPIVGDLAKGLPTQAISGLIPGGLPTDQVLGSLRADAITGQLPAATDAVTGATSRALPADTAGNTLPTDGLPLKNLLGGLPVG